MNLNVVQIAILNFKKMYVEIYIQRNNKRDIVTSIFVANINVDVQNNFNYMRDDFINKKRDDEENDYNNRKNININ